MNALRTISLAAVLVLLPSVGLVAQEDTPVVPGARVRVFAPRVDVKPLPGTVVALGADTLVLDVDGWHREVWQPRVSIPLAFLERIEVSRGKKGKSKAITGAVIGFVVTAPIGGLFGYFVCAIQYPPVGENCIVETVAGALLIGGLGAGIGALIGSAFKAELWEAVPLEEIRVGLSGAADGLAVTASIRF